MNSQLILLYGVKTVIIAGIFWAYYYVALRNKRFHYYNRFYLLSAMGASLIIPLFQFNWITIEKPVLNDAIVQFPLQYLTATKAVDTSFTWIDWLLLVVVCIALGILAMVLNNIRIIYSIKRKSPNKRLDAYHFIQTDEENAPFSFLNNLFWKKSIAIDSDYGQRIFTHEITHIKQKHTWDRLFCQFVSSIVWFNPFYWLIQKELQTIHEFIADEASVGEAGVAEFAKMLLQTHYDTHFFNPIHTFFYSSIKRRLFMLTTSSQTKFSYARRIMIMPLLFMAIAIFSIKVHAKERITEKVSELSDLILYNVSETNYVDTIPQLNYKGKKIKIAIANGETRKTYLTFEDGTKDSLSIAEAEKLFIIPPPPPQPPTPTGAKGNVKTVIVYGNSFDTVRKDNYKTISINKTISTTKVDTSVMGALGDLDINTIVKDALKSVDIQKVVNDAIKNMDFNKIVKEGMESVKVSKGKDDKTNHVTVLVKNEYLGSDTSIINIVAKENNMQVIKTNSKVIAAKALEDGAQSITMDVKDGKKTYTIVQENTNKKMPESTLIMVDGKSITQKEMADINPNTIESINVLKGESAIKKYGDKGTNGVVEITLKKK
jgi:beta-lactamase regulating signal transducer with metallopeptidase domain